MRQRSNSQPVSGGSGGRTPKSRMATTANINPYYAYLRFLCSLLFHLFATQRERRAIEPSRGGLAAKNSVWTNVYISGRLARTTPRSLAIRTTRCAPRAAAACSSSRDSNLCVFLEFSHGRAPGVRGPQPRGPSRSPVGAQNPGWELCAPTAKRVKFALVSKPSSEPAEFVRIPGLASKSEVSRGCQNPGGSFGKLTNPRKTAKSLSPTQAPVGASSTSAASPEPRRPQFRASPSVTAVRTSLSASRRKDPAGPGPINVFNLGGTPESSKCVAASPSSRQPRPSPSLWARHPFLS
jgi:hypothetical protein